jgi:predicted transcriptional regulator
VGFEKKGRIKLIKLTKKGTEVAENIENIKKLVN